MTTETVQEFCRRLSIAVKVTRRGPTAAELKDDWLRSAYHWTVEFCYTNGRNVTFTTDFHTGRGCGKTDRWGKFQPSVPTVEDVLDCVISDALRTDQSFPQWCDELGYNADSIKDRKIYDSCCDTATAIWTFLGHKEANHVRQGNVEPL